MINICAAIECPDPGVPDKGYRDKDIFNVGNTIQFSGNDGEELEGSEIRTCQADGSGSGTNATCRSKSLHPVFQ